MPIVKWLESFLKKRERALEKKGLRKGIGDQLFFKSSAPLTLGVEFELGLLDKNDLLPIHEGTSIVEESNSSFVKEEVFHHMVEITSPVGKNVQQVEEALKREIDKVTEISEKKGFLLTGTGRPPTIKMADALSRQSERYSRLIEERKILLDRFGALGMHVHIGMINGDQCVRCNNFFMHFLPHFIALSASSPFEDGIYTGLASIRPAAAESLPIAGMPYYFKDWQDYVHLCNALYRAGSITSLKDLWWDQRPSPSYGTLEIRVCDQPATLAEGMAITAFIHLLAYWFETHQDWLDEIPRPNRWRLRENKWRSMRYGLDAELVVNNQGETKPIRQDIQQWIERMEPFIKRFEYEKYIKMLEDMMTQGNSAYRQKKLWKSHQRLEDVAKFNCDEFKAQTPLWGHLNNLVSDTPKNPSVAS